MKYTAKNKINSIENNSKANKFANTNDESNSSIDSKESNTNIKATSRKNTTFYIDSNLLEEVDEFLNEYGTRKESRNFFIEEATRLYLAKRKEQIKQELKKKLQQLQ